MDTMARSLAERLPETALGQAWIEQFDELDRELARTLAQSLVLVSGIEFERQLAGLLTKTASKAAGPVAFFAVREWSEPTIPYLHETQDADAVGPGGDIGSEGRVAAVIRSLCRANPSELLNHPSLEKMRRAKCRRIILVDDFVGSGDRVEEFYAALRAHPTIKSWQSLKLIEFVLVAYSATAHGERRVTRLLDRETVLVRGCPTFQDLPVSYSERASLLDLLKRYAKRTQHPYDPLGYGNTGAALVFEHGCPDNVPVVFWAAAGPGNRWTPLFPARTVLGDEASVFPPELAIPPASTVLQVYGQTRLARSGSLSRRGAIGETVLVLLGLVAKRIRKRSALTHATGLTNEQCSALIERCISWRFLTPALRLTEKGAAELRYARRVQSQTAALPKAGSDAYYPSQLRGAGNS